MAKFNKNTEISDVIDYADSSSSSHNLKPEIDEIVEKMNTYLDKVNTTVNDESSYGLSPENYLVNGQSPMTELLNNMNDNYSDVSGEVANFQEKMGEKILNIRKTRLQEILDDITSYLENNDDNNGVYKEKQDQVQQEIDKVNKSLNIVTSKSGDSTAKPGFWARQGGRYVDDWNEMTSNIGSSWGNKGVIPFTGSLLSSASSIVQFAGDGVTDTVHSADDMVNATWNFIFDSGSTRSVSSISDYWSNIGEDYGENWHYLTSADNFIDGTSGLLYGIGATGLDAVQTSGVAAIQVVDWLDDAVESVWDFIF